MKFEPQCKKQSDLHREWARVLDMCEAAGFDRIGECTKFDGFVGRESWSLALSPERYEFAIAIVEGKPVFRDSRVFDTNTGKEFIAGEFPSSLYRATWNPPRRTITINGVEVKAPEPLVYDSRNIVTFGRPFIVIPYDLLADALAMKAALEGKKP